MGGGDPCGGTPAGGSPPAEEGRAPPRGTLGPCACRFQTRQKHEVNNHGVGNHTDKHNDHITS